MARLSRALGRLPTFGVTGEEARTDGETGAQLLTILLGKEGIGDLMQNRKQIAFANFKINKPKAKGGTATVAPVLARTVFTMRGAILSTSESM